MIETIDYRGLSRSYGYRTALSPVDFCLKRPEICLIMGPNGAGKTSMLAAMLSADADQLKVNGNPLQRAGVARYHDRTGFIGHEPGLLLDLTAEENLKYFAELFGCKTGPGEVSGLLTLVGLSHRAKDTARGFSRGMRQRLGLARMIVHKPDLLLMDEPLTGLDRSGIEVLRKVVRSEKERGAIQVIVTHSEEPFLDLADRFVFVHKSRLVADIPGPKYTPEAREKVQSLLSE